MAAFSHKTFARNDQRFNSLGNIDKPIIALDSFEMLPDQGRSDPALAKCKAAHQRSL